MVVLKEKAIEGRRMKGGWGGLIDKNVSFCWGIWRGEERKRG